MLKRKSMYFLWRLSLLMLILAPSVKAFAITTSNLSQIEVASLKTNAAAFKLSFDETDKRHPFWQLQILQKSPELTNLKIKIEFDGQQKDISLKNENTDSNLLKDETGYYFLTNETTLWKMKSQTEAKIKISVYGCGENNQYLGSLSATKPQSVTTSSTSDTGSTVISDSNEIAETQTQNSAEGSSESKQSTPDSKTDESENTSASVTADRHGQVMKKITPKNANLRAAQTGNPEVPKGAILLDGVFGDINVVGNQGSSGVNTIQDANVNNGIPYSEITLSGTRNWLSIWSNEQYKMDFSTTFHGRTYINFGKGADADGLAFVMQNENAKALTSANTADDGQNIGVYGNNQTNLFGNNKPDSKAIKKSVAIEFDLYSNNDGTHVFDRDNPTTPHMAYTFPGNLSKGYKSTSWLGENYWGVNDKAVVRHHDLKLLNGVVGDNIRDGTWYEFRYDFDSNTKTFSYYLKNPVTGSKTQTTVIPWSDLTSELGLSASNMKAYWGFTGSNGAASGTVKFVFTQVPIDLSTKIENDVLVADKSIVDIEDHESFTKDLPSASDKDTLTFHTRFSVEEGEAALKINNWKSNVSIHDIDLAKGISNINAKIGDKNYPGEARIFQQTGEIQITFNDLQVKPGEDVYFSYTAIPKKHTQTSKSYFLSHITTTEIGNNTPGDFLSKQVAFWIKGNEPPKLTQLVTTKENFTDFIDAFGYTFFYQDNDEDDLTYEVRINGTLVAGNQPLKGAEVSQQVQYTDKAQIDLLNVATSFKRGENTLQVSLSDGVNPRVTANTTFMVTGYFGFEELTDHYDWRYAKTNLPDEDTPMSRQAAMKIKIRDTRDAVYSKNVKIKFTATATNGALVTDRFTFTNQSLTNLSLPVNKELNFDRQEGLLLKLNNNCDKTTATGNAIWTIMDAP